ncbi:adhesion G protein-coupled receptor D2-like [Narcine bancroftii]|uniref:adhesion G protein-coupled receptor D2-like n=1 Tax=Narcine bancroftii TaxID=1343680 RepID=UPI0038312662
MCGSTIKLGVCVLLACCLDGVHSQDYSHSLELHSSYHVYEYIATPLKWQHASKYCELRFGSLPVVRDVEEKSVMLDLLASQGVNQQIWMKGELSETLERDKTMGENSLDKFAVLTFSNKTDTKYAKILSVLPSMSAVTACASLQWDNKTNTIGTVFSYAVPVFMNEFQLRGHMNDTGFIQLALIVHGHHTPYRSVLRSDGQWHHICVTWHTEKGAWSFYADGQLVSSGVGYYTSHLLAGNGIFIIGQDQDSLGGAFKQNEAFSGNITALNIWSRALTGGEIAAINGCSLPLQHLVYQWDLANMEIEPTVEIMQVQVNCSAANVFSNECPTFHVSGVENRHNCEVPLSFFCQFNKDTYLKLKKLESDSRSLFKTKLNEFSNNITVTEYMSLTNVKLVHSVSEAEEVLKAVQQVLSVENTTLQVADLLSVISLLQNVADMEVDASDTSEDPEDISQSFIDVAGEILDEHHAERWNEISEIVRGPMSVVYGVDRMVRNLNKVSTFGQKNIVIQNKNIQLEIRQNLLHNFTNGFEVYVGDGINKSSDQIGLPKETIERLQGKGNAVIRLSACLSLSFSGTETRFGHALLAVRPFLTVSYSSTGFAWMYGFIFIATMLRSEIQLTFNPVFNLKGILIPFCSSNILITLSNLLWSSASSKTNIENLQSLRSNHSLTATFVNTWYRTLPNLLNTGSLVETVFDEGIKHIRTQVASAVISSTVFVGGWEVSTPTQFKLLHRVKYRESRDPSGGNLGGGHCTCQSLSSSPTGK